MFYRVKVAYAGRWLTSNNQRWRLRQGADVRAWRENVVPSLYFVDVGVDMASQLALLGALPGFELERERSECGLVAHVVMPGEPVSKARARFTNYGSKTRAYTPERTREAERTLAWHFRRAAKGWTVDDHSAFGVFAVFYAGTRQRRDVDNMMKLVLDACNRVVWQDDSQVIEISGRVVFGDPNPRTEVAVYVVERQAPLEAACIRCGKAFRMYKSWIGKKRYCSAECRAGQTKESRRAVCENCGKEFVGWRAEQAKFCSDQCQRSSKSNVLRCVQCGTVFRRWRSWSPTGDVVLCSKDCAVAFWRSAGVKIKKGVCEVCGGPVSRREYKRCRACSIAMRPASKRLTTATTQAGAEAAAVATPAEIRAWAAASGLRVNPRGRLPIAVLEAYALAHAADGRAA